jgi:hypothetical protein
MDYIRHAITGCLREYLKVKCLLSWKGTQPQRDQLRLAPISDASPARIVQSKYNDRRNKVGDIPASPSPWESLPACRDGRLREITARSEAQVTRHYRQQYHGKSGCGAGFSRGRCVGAALPVNGKL